MSSIVTASVTTGGTYWDGDSWETITTRDDLIKTGAVGTYPAIVGESTSQLKIESDLLKYIVADSVQFKDVWNATFVPVDISVTTRSTVYAYVDEDGERDTSFTGNIALYKDGTVVHENQAAVEGRTVFAKVEPGTYTVYLNDVETCATITVNNGDYSKFVTVNYYTVEFSAGDNVTIGSTSTTGGVYMADTEITAVATVTDTDNYAFLNWTDNNDDNAVVSTDATYTTTLSGKTQLTAHAQAAYAITYNGNDSDGGSAPTVTGKQPANAAFALDTTHPFTREDYAQIGWALAADANATEVITASDVDTVEKLVALYNNAVDSDVAPGGEITLYAVWISMEKPTLTLAAKDSDTVTAKGTVTDPDNEIYYMVHKADVAAPTATAIQGAGNKLTSGTDLDVDNLDAYTAYILYAVAEDKDGNLSAVAKTVAVTTWYKVTVKVDDADATNSYVSQDGATLVEEFTVDVKPGETLSLSSYAKPATGHQVDAWTSTDDANGSIANNIFTPNTQGQPTIVVAFETIPDYSVGVKDALDVDFDEAFVSDDAITKDAVASIYAVTVKNTGNREISDLTVTSVDNNDAFTITNNLIDTTVAANTEVTGNVTLQLKDTATLGTYTAVVTVTGKDAEDNDIIATYTLNVTVKAPVSSSIFRYTSSVAPTENGIATISSDRNTAITYVVITATPDEGYEVADVVVCDANGKEVAVTEKSDGTYTYKQPASTATVTVTFAVLGTVDHDSFVDVDADDWFYDAVLWAVENGITSGTSDTTFSPSAGCTRAQAVTFLWTAAGKPQVDIDNPFTDVSEDAWYYDAVLWAVSEGITAGTSDTTFSPSKDCTRAQIVTFLWRAAGEPVVNYLMTFEDVASDAWYAEAVRWAVSEGITKGISDTAFSPSMDCTRGQIVTFLYKAQAE